MNYDQQQDYDHQQSVVYGYKDGMGLIMDALIPTQHQNGAAVIALNSGGFSSNLDKFSDFPQRRFTKCLLNAGYIVFIVAHSSSPKYRIDEIIPDISRAIRFIRHHAGRFGIDPHRIGIRGSSSGGMLSLMAATTPLAADPEAKDPVDRVSSQVQAVVAYFPPTDFIELTRAHSLNHPPLDLHYSPLDFHNWDEEAQRYERVIDPEETKAIFRQCSPTTHISADTPPTLLLHGDEDERIPIQQSELFAARLRELGVPHKLIVAKGKGHGWDPPLENELNEIWGWFDRYLLNRGASVSILKTTSCNTRSNS
ncbi:MAG: prolyl oligopeptidase family serine peptidase [Gemmatimonadetes bacterium]|jgi:acetyl esterase/lipase|nr:prolyl oligopeptidase family serine peptidase [Gemmatimonadota bacterium]